MTITWWMMWPVVFILSVVVGYLWGAVRDTGEFRESSFTGIMVGASVGIVFVVIFAIWRPAFTIFGGAP